MIVKLRERESKGTGSTQEKIFFKKWMVDILTLMLYIKFGCHPPPPPSTVLLLISRIKPSMDQVR